LFIFTNPKGVEAWQIHQAFDQLNEGSKASASFFEKDTTRFTSYFQAILAWNIKD
jgi:hypothetical protein